MKQFLTKSFPALKVEVKRTKISKKFDGFCMFKNGLFKISICNQLKESEAIDALLHEFAHCLSWEKEKNEHGLQWGKAYSIVYRAFLKWYRDYE